VLAGEDCKYTIAVRTGATAATDVEVVDTLDEGVDLDGPLPANCTSTEAASIITVRCDLGTVAANTTETITLNVEAPEAAPQTIVNEATCTGATVPMPCTDFVTTNVLPAADLVITKEDNPAPVDVGYNLAYTLRVTNRGPQTATDVELVDDLPGNVIFIGLDEGENRCNLRPGQVVECDLVDLAPGDSTKVRVFVEPEEAGTLTSTARVRSATADPRRSNNVDSATTTVEGEAQPTEPPEETAAEETTTDETTTDDGDAAETRDDTEANSIEDGEDDVGAGTIPEMDELPETGGPGGYVLAAGCALLGMGLILNRRMAR
jgi:uncharacterized repeat protein (TIGR01451 family)